MMQTITFEVITEKMLNVVKEIVHSNKSYNLLENGRETRTTEELKEEFLNPSTKSMFIKLGNSYIGCHGLLGSKPKGPFSVVGFINDPCTLPGKGIC
jgi:hypothetical protein